MRNTKFFRTAALQWLHHTARFIRVTFLFRSGIYIILTVSILPQLSHIDTKCIDRQEYDIHVIADTYLLSDPYNEEICLNVCNDGNISKFDDATSVRYRTKRSKQNEKKKNDILNLYRLSWDITGTLSRVTGCPFHCIDFFFFLRDRLEIKFLATKNIELCD